MKSEKKEKLTKHCSPGLEKVLGRLGFVSPESVRDLGIRFPDKKIVAALVLSGFCESEDRLLEAICRDLGLAQADLRSVKAVERIRDEGHYTKVSSEILLNNRCLPLYVDEEHLVAAMADPLDLEAISQLEFALAARLKIQIAKESEIVALADRLLSMHAAESINLEDGGVSLIQTEVDLNASGVDEGASDEEGSAAAPVIRFVNQILAEAHTAKASDIHLEPSAGNLEVRYRIDGVMVPQLSIPKRLQSYVTARLKILAGMDITEKRRPQDGRFRIRTGDASGIDIRASSVPTPFGEKLVLRLLRSDVAELSLNALSLPESVAVSLKEILQSRDRIVLVCGPTGSGKTTTLYCALNELRQTASNIITVEDPIEIRLPGITQIQVDSKIGMTFASGLRSILRQDPDIILVGEIRDHETAEVAFQAAQTGHFVLSTLHSNTAPSAVVRLVDIGLEPYIVASSLGGILAQRLVRRVCSQCVEPASADEIRSAEKKYSQSFTNLRVGKGCAACEQTGYHGRVAVYSLLVVTNQVRELIRNKASEQEIHDLAKALGMKDLFEAGLELAARGETTIAEIERVIGLGELIDSRGVGVRKGSFSNIPGQVPSEVSSEPRAARSTTKDEHRTAPEAERGSIESLVAEFRAAHQEDAKKRSRVLLVDDDEGVRAVMSRILQRSDFDVCEAANGYEALDKLMNFWPDIIVTDLVMPGLGGKELIEELRKNQETSKIPVLMLTGSDNEENEIEMITLGARDFVSKSSSPVLVIARMRRLLNPNS